MTKKIYLETLKKCPGSLHFPLLIYPMEKCRFIVILFHLHCFRFTLVIKLRNFDFESH